MLCSNKSVGIIGGGQLAKLLALEGRRIGLNLKFWADSSHTAIDGLGDRFDKSQCSLTDFCHSVDTIAIDYEHIPEDEIKIIEQFAPYTGRADLLRVASDRLNEKLLQERLSLNLNPYVVIHDAKDLFTARELLQYPFILKKRRQSYDGMGQITIKNENDFLSASQKEFSDHYIAEKFIDFDKEYSLLCVRSQNGEFKAYDLCENIHKDGILTHSKNIHHEELKQKATLINKSIAEHCRYVGVFAVEYFYSNGQLIINEISPRVHNSGHWTLDGAVCNQFENHLRACLGLPLGSTESYMQIHMYNILGDYQHYQELLNHPHAKIYDYNKKPRSKRKLGHVNIYFPPA